MIKEAIRQHFKTLRAELGKSYKKEANLGIERNVLDVLSNISIKTNDQKIIAGYYPINGEVDVLHVLLQMEKYHDLQIALPAFDINFDIFKFKTWSFNESLKSNKFGIPEPACGKEILPHIVLIPIIAFDRAFNRLGYGRGYYDRMLYDAEDHIVKIGCAFAMQEANEIPQELHDIKLDIIITEREVLRK